MLETLALLETPCAVMFNKADVRPPSAADTSWCDRHGIPWLSLAARTAGDPLPIREMIIRLAPQPETLPPLVVDLLPDGGTVLCVTPIDASAPKGRLIVPQVQVLRELVEHHHLSLLIQPEELPQALERFGRSPDLVITDSQAVKQVSAAVPAGTRMTTFSLLLARQKGDFALMHAGAGAIAALRDGDRILVAEACSHHAQDDDIARVKIPRLLRIHTGKNLDFDICTGKDFPENFQDYAMVIHCGGCMLNRCEMRRRLRLCAAAGLPVSNFGMVLSLAYGVLDTVAAPLLDPSMRA